MTQLIKDYGSVIVACCALLVSTLALRMTRRKTRLDIQQALLKMATDKAKDCNKVWEIENEKFIKKYPKPNGIVYNYSMENEEYSDSVSELVISKEQIINAFSLFELEPGYLTIVEKQKVIFAFWKQLNTSIRGFLVEYAVVRAIEKYNKRTTYGDQVLSIQKFSQSAWENLKTLHKFTELEGLPNTDNLPAPIY